LVIDLDRHHGRQCAVGIDDHLAATAERQLGLLTIQQALHHGLTRRQVQQRLESGAWKPRHTGVVAIAGAPRHWMQDLAAACLTAEPGAVASHRSAAKLWGTDNRVDVPVEITVTRPQRPRLDGVIVHRSRDLTPIQVTTIGPALVTTPVRTLVDLGQVVPWWTVERTLETMLGRGLVTIANVRAALLLHSRRGRNGCGALRQVLERRALGDEPAESVLEAAFASLCTSAGLPTPQFQVPVTLGGRQVRLDFVFVSQRVAVEVDGFEFHSGRAQFEDDRFRDAELVAAGWHVLRFTWVQVTHRAWWVAEVLRRSLDRDDTDELVTGFNITG
jgi:very-short-patch-repair endonuclease